MEGEEEQEEGTRGKSRQRRGDSEGRGAAGSAPMALVREHLFSIGAPPG